MLSGCMMISERQGFWVRWSLRFVSEESSLELFGHLVKSIGSNCGKKLWQKNPLANVKENHLSKLCWESRDLYQLLRSGWLTAELEEQSKT